MIANRVLHPVPPYLPVACLEWATLLSLTLSDTKRGIDVLHVEAGDPVQVLKSSPTGLVLETLCACQIELVRLVLDLVPQEHAAHVL